MVQRKSVIKSAFESVGEVFTNMWGGTRRRSATYMWSVAYNPWSELDYLRAFSEIPELNAVICTHARMFGNGVIKEVNVSDLSEVKNSKLVAAINNPNWFQGGEEFRRQTKLWRQIFGNEYLYELAPVGVDYENAISKGLFSIPPNWMEVQYKENAPFFTFVEMPEGVKYIVKYGSNDITIPKSDLIHLNDDRVNMRNTGYTTGGVSMLKGESKCKALTPALNNLKMAYETRGGFLKNRGAYGILAGGTKDNLGSMPLTPDEQERIQKEYKNNYGGLDGQMNVIITAAGLTWQQMSINPDKMGLYTETAEDFNKIIDAYGSKRELYAGKDVTYENQKAAEKAVYTDTIIPDAAEWIGGFNKKHRPAGSKTKLIMDYFHLPIFQEDLGLRGASLKANVDALSIALTDQAITIDDYKELEKFGIKSQTLN